MVAAVSLGIPSAGGWPFARIGHDGQPKNADSISQRLEVAKFAVRLIDCLEFSGAETEWFVEGLHDEGDAFFGVDSRNQCAGTCFLQIVSEQFQSQCTRLFSSVGG